MVRREAYSKCSSVPVLAREGKKEGETRGEGGRNGSKTKEEWETKERMCGGEERPAALCLEYRERARSTFPALLAAAFFVLNGDDAIREFLLLLLLLGNLLCDLGVQLVA